MNQANSKSASHWSLWLVGIIAIVWHGLGCMNFAMQLNPDMLAKMPDSHQAIAAARPIWAIVGFGISVITGTLGGLLVLLKKRVAMVFLVLSLLGAIAATAQGVMGGAVLIFSPGEIALGIVGPTVFGLFLVWYTRYATSKNWLR